MKVWEPDVDGDDWHCVQTLSRETCGEVRVAVVAAAYANEAARLLARVRACASVRAMSLIRACDVHRRRTRQRSGT